MNKKELEKMISRWDSFDKVRWNANSPNIFTLNFKVPVIFNYRDITKLSKKEFARVLVYNLIKFDHDYHYPIYASDLDMKEIKGY